MNKPYHLMTQAERTAQRIALNRSSDARVAPVLRVQKRVERAKDLRKFDKALGELIRSVEIEVGMDILRIVKRNA